MRKDRHGFTIIEVIIVIVIIGVLATVAGPRLLSTNTHVEVSEAISWMDKISSDKQVCYYENDLSHSACPYDSSGTDLLSIGAPNGAAGFVFVADAYAGAGQNIYEISACKAGSCLWLLHGASFASFNAATCATGARTNLDDNVVRWYACNAYAGMQPK